MKGTVRQMVFPIMARMRVWLIAAWLAVVPLCAFAQATDPPPEVPEAPEAPETPEAAQQPPETGPPPARPVTRSPVERREEVLAAFADDPGDPQAVAQRGRFYREIGNGFLAEQDFRAAIRLLDNAGRQDAGIWRELALTLAARGELREALGAWDTAVELSPDDLSLYVERGGLKLSLADQAGAQEDFRVALAAAGEDPEVLSLIGDMLHAAGEPERALGFYERAYTASPGPLLAGARARMYLELGDYDAAQREIDLALAGLPDDPDILGLAGEIERAAGNSAGALEYYRRAAEQYRSPEHLIAMVEHLEETNDPAAEDSWTALTAAYPGYPVAWLARGRHYCAVRRFDLAAADFSRALELVPEYDSAEHSWAECLVRRRDIEGAIVHYRRAIDLDPSPEYYVELIRLTESRPGGAREAEALWTELFAVFPDHPAALLANGDRLASAGNCRAAIEVYRHGAKTDPGNPRFPQRIGDCLARQEDYFGAVQYYADSLDLEYNAGVVRRLTGAYRDSGSPVQAEAVWRSYESLHPADPELALAHGDALLDREDFNSALSQFRRGQRLAPGDPEFHARAARCHTALGEPEQAVAALQAALQLRSEPQYYLQLAEVYEQQGETDLAGQQYARGLEQFPADPELNEAHALFAQRSEPGGALGQMEQAAGVSGGAEMYLRAAEQALTEGDESRAEGNYLAALRANPEDVAAATGLALLYAGQGRQAELLELMADAAELMPPEGFGMVADKLGAWWIESRDYQSGSKFYEDLLERAGPHPTLYTALALLYWLEGGGATALDVLDEALSAVEPTYYLSYLQAMMTHEEQGAAAARPLAEGLLDDPELDEDGLLLALEIYRELGESQLRVETASRGLDRFPDSTAVYEQLALAYYYGGQTPSAIALLEDPDYQPLWFDGRDQLLGYCYLDGGNFVKASSFLGDAVRRDGADAGLWAALGEARYFIGAYPEARQALTTALALDEGLAAAHLWLGFVLIEQGEYSGARAALEGVAQSPRATSYTLAWAALGLGRVEALSGNRRAAAELFGEAEAYGLTGPVFTNELASARAEAGLR